MAALIDLTTLLLQAQSADQATRLGAENHLKLLEEQNYTSFVYSLSIHLADGTKNVDARRLAGLVLKNLLDSQDDARKVSF